MSGPIRPLDPDSYQRHLIHGEGRTWAETNCYVDVLVELLHGLGHEPIAALPFTLRIDFEGDQWTFFKFAHADLLDLYGLDVQELNPWRKLASHVEQQVDMGRPVLVELDSFFLPDTHGTAYQLEHVKSTVAVNEIDVDAGYMEYFHGQGYYRLDGSDFHDIFQLDGLVHDRMLPPYVEYLKTADIQVPTTEGELVEASLACLNRQMALMPTQNPFIPFRARFEVDLEWLMGESIEVFHQYSFATLRQYGACFELAATYTDWLSRNGVEGLDDITAALDGISTTAKAFQFQLARAIARKRTLDPQPIEHMQALWTQATEPLVDRFS